MSLCWPCGLLLGLFAEGSVSSPWSCRLVGACLFLVPLRLSAGARVGSGVGGCRGTSGSCGLGSWVSTSMSSMTMLIVSVAICSCIRFSSARRRRRLSLLSVLCVLGEVLLVGRRAGVCARGLLLLLITLPAPTSCVGWGGVLRVSSAWAPVLFAVLRRRSSSSTLPRVSSSSSSDEVVPSESSYGSLACIVHH